MFYYIGTFILFFNHICYIFIVSEITDLFNVAMNNYNKVILNREVE